MSYIDFISVQAAEQGLLEQIFILQNLREELERAEQKIKDMAYTEETIFLLRRCRREIEDEIYVLRSFFECLEQVRGICRKTEQRIVDTYNLEEIVYPKTTFGINVITGLDKYKHLLTFHNK